MTPVEEILDLARWAPSGDNTQPWRFEIVSPSHFVVHGFDTRADCVYDLDGHSSQLAVGGLLETIGIAATKFGRTATTSRRPDTPDTHLLFDVRLAPSPKVTVSDLVPAITVRSVQRRALSTRPLTGEQKAALEASVAPGHEVVWIEGWGPKIRLVRLLWRNAGLRLTLPEAFEVHRRIIDWGKQFSDDKVPDQALGLDPMTLKLTRWAFASWRRVDLLNRYAFGTWAPRIQLDLIPGLACGAHAALVSRDPLQGIDDYVASGRAMQRFWLTACRLGLQLQPEMTPVIFSRYAWQQRQFSRATWAHPLADRLRSGLDEILGASRSQRAAFMARLGLGPRARARSRRRLLGELRFRRASD